MTVSVISDVDVWVVLCEPDDEAAVWAHAGLRRRGLNAQLISPSTLVWSPRCVHRLGADRVDFEITLPGGHVLDSQNVRGVLNRATSTPVVELSTDANADARYTGEELTALLLSWLTCVPAIINRPDPRGLPGAWRAPVEWAALAAQAGLSVPPMPLSADVIAAPRDPAGTITVVVVGERVFGAAVATATAQACVRLAHAANAAVLGIDLVADAQGDLYFAGATPVPDLRLGGDDLVDELQRELCSRQARVP
jgi:hypothetical protein